MPTLSMVALDDLSLLRCPYCGRAISADTAWAEEARERWGWIGAVAKVEGAPTGVLLVAPGTEPSGSSTAMLMCLWVHPDAAGMGTGRQLVQTVAAGLLPRHTRFMVAHGGRQQISCAAPPRDFLRSVGFHRVGNDRLWRLDLDQTVVERPSLREVLGRLVGTIRPAAPPAPAGRGTLR